eukprot:3142605-Rhodomonas_salina.4
MSCPDLIKNLHAPRRFSVVAGAASGEMGCEGTGWVSESWVTRNLKVGSAPACQWGKPARTRSGDCSEGPGVRVANTTGRWQARSSAAGAPPSASGYDAITFSDLDSCPTSYHAADPSSHWHPSSDWHGRSREI